MQQQTKVSHGAIVWQIVSIEERMMIVSAECSIQASILLVLHSPVVQCNQMELFIIFFLFNNFAIEKVRKHAGVLGLQLFVWKKIWLLQNQLWIHH